MPVDKEFPLYGDNGLRGVLLSPTRFLEESPERRIRLDDGREMNVPSDLLEARRDGSFYLRSSVAETIEPTPAQEIEPPQSTRGSMRQAEPAMPEVPNEPLLREDCEVERVSIRKLLDRPAETRQEGDTFIVPLMEEVWVVEKRLMLREELHIKRKTVRYSDSKPILRDELNGE